MVVSGGIFSAIHTVKELSFFTEYPPADLDMLLNTLHGQKIVTPSLIDKSALQVAVMLVTQYEKKWNDLYTWFNIEHPFNASSVDNIEETISTISNAGSDSNSINFESAFNDDSYVPSNKNESGVDELTETDRTRTYKQTRESLQAMTIRQSMLERAVFNDYILNDIKHFMCLGVY